MLPPRTIPLRKGAPPALPPESPRPQELVLIREPEQDKVLIVLESGESWLLNSDRLKFYLTRLGCPNADVLVDYVWNFYCIWVGTENWEYLRVSRADAMRALSERKEMYVT